MTDARSAACCVALNSATLIGRPLRRRAQRSDLIPLQGDQGRDDHRQTTEQQPADLVDRALAAARGQHGQGVAPGADFNQRGPLRGSRRDTQDLVRDGVDLGESC